jgi:hypothetical protein
VRPDVLDEAHTARVCVVEDGVERLFALDLDFAVGPAWDFDDVVDDLLVGFVGVYGDVMPERY